MAQTLDELARSQIAKWIQSTGITQTDLATRIGRNQAWMSRYLKGEFNADLDTLQLMTRVFGHELTSALNIPANPEEAALISAYRALRPDGRRLILSLLEDWTRGGRRPKAPRR